MCGINGIITANFALKKKIIKANELIRHRGPDDEGYIVINKDGSGYKQFSGINSAAEIKNLYPYIEISENNKEQVILAHRRLSIIDLSYKGHCPMSTEDGNYWITYNGEIYNYIELREELVNAGYKFKSATDTEVILNSFLHWGINCLNKFNGMWSFAIWDCRNNKLFAARDRFGVKPFYYTNTNDYFAFSSEVKPLVNYFTTPPIINSNNIPYYIINGNRFNGNETYIKDIFSLPASHYLIYESNCLTLKQYYDIEYKRTESNENTLAIEIADLLKNSITLRFRSDVPVGTCLSGGFDSSSIVSLASRSITNRKIETFSAVWNESSCDESYYIDIVNNEFGCTPNKIIPREEDFDEIFRKISYFQEFPTEGPGLYPQWYVMKKAKEKVKVLLDGQGGDEVFGGYFQLGAYLRGVIKDRNIISNIKDAKYFMEFVNKNGFHSFASWLFPKHYHWLTKSKLSKKYNIINKELLNKLNNDDLVFDLDPPDKFGNYLSNLSYHFIRNITIPALLHYEDRSSMAHSIESRVPFMDFRIVELGVNLDAEYLSDKGVSRPLYRKALRKYLPEKIVNRKDKLGFPVPFAEWTRGSLKNMIIDTFSDQNNLIYDFIDKSELENNLNAHFKEQKDFSWQIWRLLSLNYFINKICKKDF
ncbi:MAG: asparagine synthase (glutamine-hydrolyzing) [Ignavibacteria bacterium]|nr:asparagine synthase (glutamine-hydrolyzing) [Ignavibacteria bacterium]